MSTVKDVVLLSENTVVILFEQNISLDIAREVSRYQAAIEQVLSDFIIDMVPSYASIHITFNLRKVRSGDFNHSLKTLFSEIDDRQVEQIEKRLIEIPIYYGDEVGFDLTSVAEKAGLTSQQVINIHAGRVYDVYAMGFAPGFAFLGSVDERIATPRKKSPRKHIPAGSLGIANQQTAIYPSDSPGGWQIIGKTPINLVDYSAEEPTVIKSNCQIKFIPISKQTFIEMGGEI